MHLVEYRICLPFTVEEYKRAQLYMIARHCHEESDNGEGVEVVKYEPCEDPKYGKGHYTEKRIHLYSKLPTWMQSIIPNMFYVEEKSWNYYPFTITEYSCSFLPKFHINVETKYEDNSGETENAHNLTGDEYSQRVVDVIDIMESVPEHKYKEAEDPAVVVVKKTTPARGPLSQNWIQRFRESKQPVMCSYKIVRAKFEVWGLQTKVEAWTQKAIRDILLLAHRQAFCWTDEWYHMDYESIVNYEKETYARTNEKVLKNNNTANPPDNNNNNNSGSSSSSTTTSHNPVSRLSSYFSGGDKRNVEEF